MAPTDRIVALEEAPAGPRWGEDGLGAGAGTAARRDDDPRERALQILLQVVESMTTAGGVRSALNRLASLALQATGADRCGIFVRDPSGRARLLPAAGASRVGDDLDEQWRKFRAMEPIDVEADASRLTLWQAPRVVTLNDAGTSSLIPETWKRIWGSKSVAIASLRAGGESHGILAVDYVGERHVFTPSEARLLEAIARGAGAALAQARMRETLEARLRAIEAMHRLSDVVVRTSDLKAVLASLNSSVCREIGVECLRATFNDPALIALLRLKRPDAAEIAMLRRWRSEGSSGPQVVDGRIVVPIPIAGRIAGVLWMRAADGPDPGILEFAEAIAGGLGEVALKAKLRRTAERRAQELAVAGERERIARDLHDTVGQTFYGIGLKLQEMMADVADTEVLGKLSQLRGLAARAVSDVRSAVYALSFLHVRASGLVPSLRELVQQFGRATVVNAEFRAERRIPRLPKETESALFRMAHEALVNVDRHARATGVVVSLTASNGSVELSIRDDGVGLDQRQVADWQSAAHFGMRTMARAIEQAGGDFTVAPALPRGLLIKGTVPVRAVARPDRSERP